MDRFSRPHEALHLSGPERQVRVDQSNLLILAMVEKCRETIEHSPQTVLDLPAALGPKHLLWMCEQIERHAETWPATKVHRWIGYVRSGMIANRILDLDAAKKMFDVAKNSYGVSSADLDLVDHLNDDTAFELEIGGQG
jgi:hypothetical protein